jgi:hypothetical protein
MGVSGLEKLEQSIAVPRTTQTAEPPDPFWDSYGLAGNPFPPSRTIIREIIYDQVTQYDRFITLVGELLESPPKRRALAIVAGTGGGKTHFLHYCQWTFDEVVCKKQQRKFLTVEVVAGASTTLDLVHAILTAADAHFRDEGSGSLGSALVNRAQDKESDVFGDAHVDDVRSALEHLSRAVSNKTAPDPRGLYTPEVLFELFGRWLQGATLTETQKKYLGVVSRLSTGPVAIRALTDLLHIARKLGLLEGVFLSVDEMESLFGGAIRASQYQSFLQDLRFLFDQAVTDNKGYSLLILTTATPFGANSLLNAIYPLYQRLSYEGPGRVQLDPIGSPEQAKEFATVFIQYSQRKWKESVGTRTPKRDAFGMLSDAEIRAAFREAAALGGEGDGKPVSQGPLLDALWRAANAARERK